MKHIQEYIDNDNLISNNGCQVNEFLVTCLAIIGVVLFAKTASAAVNVTGEMVEDFWDWTFNSGAHTHTLK